MYAVCVVLRLHPGKRDEFMPMIQKNARTSLLEEPACHRFDIASDSGDADAVFLYELYTDRAGFDTHLASDHFKLFDAASTHLVADKTIVTWDTVLS